MALDDMSAYEHTAWEHSLDVLYAPTGGRFLPMRARESARHAVTRTKDWVGELPGAEQLRDIVERVLDGSLELTFQPALRSVRPERTVRRFARRHPSVKSMDDIRGLELRDCDDFVPPRTGYTLAAGAQGSATALAVTGAEVSTTVSGGTTAAVAIAAVATDVVASMALMGRSIGVVASRYGYDVRLPGEEVFAMGVLSLGAAGSLAAKVDALSALSRLTQHMMRRASWRQLSEHVLVRVVARAYQLLGLRLTQAKLAQAVPVIGIGINAALSAHLTARTFQRAQAVYQLRFLSERYDIDPKEWMRGPTHAQAIDLAGAEEVVDIEEILEEEASRADNADEDDA